MTGRAIAIDLGRKDYSECWRLQLQVHQARRKGLIPDCLLLVEHANVFTFGKGGKKDNLLVPEPLLRKQGIPCVTIERGGDVTYHGPGQLVGYPIFALKDNGLGVLDFVEHLEEVMIRILKDYGITGQRNERNRGVWMGNEKIGFVGVAVRRGISFHGFALNVEPELSFFQMIHPCGLKGVRAVSMASLLGRGIPLSKVKLGAIFHFKEVFEISIDKMEMDGFLANLPFSEPPIHGR